MKGRDKHQDMTDAEKKLKTELTELTNRVVDGRKRPLLVLFYPNDMQIEEPQIELLHRLLTLAGLHRSDPLEHLDIMIHTLGGEPTIAYRIAQVIRDFTQEAIFLVPQYAYSGGTLICLSGDDVLLGDYAVLSPIDITLHRHFEVGDEEEHPRFPSEQQQDIEIELVAIDHFIKVATQARVDIEAEFRRRGWTSATSNVENALLCEMVKELGVIEIAKFYREKNLTQEFARELLTSYMFKKEPISQRNLQNILKRLVVEAPGHEFSMDYHICADVGLRVTEMTEELDSQSKELTRHLARMAHEKMICKDLHGIRLPFFQFFQYTPSQEEAIKGEVVSALKEATDGAEGENTRRGKRENTTPKRRKGA